MSTETLRRLLGEATKGEWKATHWDMSDPEVSAGDDSIARCHGELEDTDHANDALIAAATAEEPPCAE